MKKISPEIDQLMWSITESGNIRAIEEFEARYPEYRVELTKRLAMVHELKVNRPHLARPTNIPTFHPREPASTWSPRMVWTAGAMSILALSALAFASQAVISHFRTPEASPNKSPMIVQNQPGPTDPNALSPGPSPVPTQPVNPNRVDSIPVAPTRPEPKWKHSQSVHLRSAPMQSVLKLVALQGGLSLEIAPRTPDPSIDADYEGMNAFEILKEMGRTYSFTPLWDEEDRSVLIIPAVAHPDSEDSTPKDPAQRIVP